MREIKFRAWTGEEMWDEVVILDKDHVMRKDPGCPLNAGIKQLPQEFELMQYTGLKDKNGKEIYEGDVIDGVEFVATNLFHNNLGLVDIPLKEQWIEISTDLERREVVGNIYENPELLKDERRTSAKTKG